MGRQLWGGERTDLDAYLQRVGFTGALEPTARTLRELHRAHVTAVPFENLEIVLGRPVPLDLESLQAKLVRQRRGGYCFEHTLLFAAVLERLGFAVTGLGARVRMGSGEKRRAATHALLRVDVEGRPWLADVGFGGEGLLEPVPLEEGAEVRQGGWTFTVAAEARGVRVLRSLHPDGWFDLHAFTEDARYPEDYEVMNHYISTHPRSPFTTRPMVQRTEDDVRRSLVGSVMVTSRPDGSHRRREIADGELPDVLEEFFGIELGADDRAALRRVRA
ncbi:arylamine N-acetyltransferase [Streptomyces sp. NPDC059637]|uniref:arylamine N-acetyltransferase family protein n=1 Tax=Streptomyces sp. NPDC059637 TaxID=3347752 RepID=UPI0036CEA6C0